MSKYTADQVADLIKSTQYELGKGKITDISQTMQNFVALPQILKRKQKQNTAGAGIQRQVLTTRGGNARQTGLFDQDNINVNDGLQTVTVPWRYTTNAYAFDLREDAMNGGAEEIVDLIKVRRQQCMNDMAVHLENQVWTAPASSTDTTETFGIPYWVVKNATKGFNGGNPSGFSAGAGNLDSATYTTWKNWTDTYSDVTKADFIEALAEAFHKTDFKSPIEGGLPTYDGGGMDQVIYAEWDSVRKLELIGEQQNENLGRDLDRMAGRILFRGVPIQVATKLEDDTDNPFYLINWSKMNPVFLGGWYFNEKGPDKVAGQHNVMAVHTDLQWNLVCVDRRGLGVIYQA